MSQFGVSLEDSSVRSQSDSTASLGLLTGHQADGEDRAGTRWRSLRERLRFKGIGCCGPTWIFGRHSISVGDVPEDEDHQEHVTSLGQDLGSDPVCLSPVRTGLRINLGAALAADRGAEYESTEGGSVPPTPARVSLMRLLKETDGWDLKEKETGATLGGDPLCCVCMVREKGAAFIPCGHTYCRACSREVWLNRGMCPLCNRPIIDILDIY